VIRNTVAKGYNARQYFADGGRVATVQGRIPLRSRTFESVAFAQAAEFVGSARVSLAVVPDQPAFLVAARLLAVSPTDKVQVLATGAFASRQGSKLSRIEFDLRTSAAVVPKDYRLRLEIRNQHIDRPLDNDVFQWLPSFSAYTVKVRHRPSALSWIELHERRFVVPDLATESSVISITSPQRHDFTARSSPDWQGSVYIVFVSLSGQGPVQALPSGSELFLTSDEATRAFALAVNRPLLVRFAGILDKTGAASCRLDLGLIAPLPVFLTGMSLHLAPLIYDEQRGWHAGAPTRLRFE
jgi:hypothetical protein